MYWCLQSNVFLKKIIYVFNIYLQIGIGTINFTEVFPNFCYQKQGSKKLNNIIGRYMCIKSVSTNRLIFVIF